MIGTASLHLWLLLLIPFAGFVLNGLLGSRLPKAAASFLCLAASAMPLYLAARIATIWKSLTIPHSESLSFHLPGIGAASWIAASTFRGTFSFLLDPLSLLMLLLVTGVSFLVHLHAIGCMAKRPGYSRFYSYLNLLLFFMLLLVLADNFLLMFAGWAGLSLASCLLISFPFSCESAASAGKKAFILNRIGDFGFLLAMFLMISRFDSLSFSNVFHSVARQSATAGDGYITAICLLLLLGAIGKSAQIPLYVWLPDATEGPAPASALLQAATIVPAGVYLIARCHVLFTHSPAALTLLAILGAATALFASTIALVETDLERVLAYSTISQFGLMFLACGAAAWSAAVFHLTTHAFSKALLFLASGSIIQTLGGERDMRLMGGMRKVAPITFWCATAATFALAGVPPFSGFFSGHEILYSSFLSPSAGPALWAVGLLVIFLTAFYMFRLWYLTFFGRRPDRGSSSGDLAGRGAAPLRESPWIMLVPIMVLALLSLGSGFTGIPQAFHGGHRFATFLEPALNAPRRTFEELSIQMALEGAPAAAAASAAQPPEQSRNNPLQERILGGTSVAAIFLGWWIADLFYRRRPGASTRLAARFRAVFLILRNRYWVDELYGVLVVSPLLLLSRAGLAGLVDRGLVHGSERAAAAIVRRLGYLAEKVQPEGILSRAAWIAAATAALLLLTYFRFVRPI